jgi:WD40 repeat protein
MHLPRTRRRLWTLLCLAALLVLLAVATGGRFVRLLDTYNSERERRQLTAAGLLVRDERKSGTPVGCATQNGFVVAFPNDPGQTASWAAYRDPWETAQPLVLDVPDRVAHVASDALGKRIAAAAGNRVRVWDAASAGWQLAADIPGDYGEPIAVSADGKLLAHGSRKNKKIFVTNVSDGQSLLSISAESCRTIAFHPLEKWIAVGGNPLVLVEMQEKPRRREFLVGGRFVLGAGERASLVSDGIDPDQIEKEGPPAKETVDVVGFSRNGRWLWCGTNNGLRVYDWLTVVRESGTDMPKPTWTFNSREEHMVPVTPFAYLAVQKEVSAVAEEGDARAVVFGGAAGRLYRLDLATGEVRELIKFSGELTRVCGLSLSSDGKTLGVTVQTDTLPMIPIGFGYGELRWSWQVWSYARLCESSRPSAR